MPGRAALWLVLAGCGLAMLPVFAAFLPVDLGLDPRLEPMPIVLHASAALCALGCFLYWLAAPGRASEVARHPMVLAALAVALWSAAVAPAVDYPLLSLLGNKVFGEGAVRYAALAVFFASALLISRHAGLAPVLHGIVSLGSFAAPIVMFVWGQGFFVSLDLVGPFALSGAVGGWLLAARAPAWARSIVAAGAAAPALALASNHTIIAALILSALPGAILCHATIRAFPGRDRIVRVVLVLAVAIASFLGLALKWLLPDLVSVPSILSRHLLDRVLFAGLIGQPSILAVGQGWGAIGLTFDSHALAAGAVMWDGSWDLSQRFVEHSHGVFSEALFGAGLPAVIGVWAMLAAPVLVAPRRRLPLVAFAILAYAGFGSVSGEFPATAGAVALALGLAADPAGEWRAGSKWMRGVRAWAAVPAGLATLLAAAAAWQLAHGEAIRARVQDVRENGMGSVAACDLHPHSELNADIALIQGLVRTYRPVFERLERGETVDRADLDLVAAYMCSAEARAGTSTSASLHLGMETFRTDVALAEIGAEARQRFSPATENWPRKVARALNAAPERPDLAKGFFAAHLQAGDVATVMSLADVMIRRDPQDPVALWFKGLAMMRDPGRQRQGRAFLVRALDAGAARILPIPAETVRQVRERDPSDNGGPNPAEAE